MPHSGNGRLSVGLVGSPVARVVVCHRPRIPIAASGLPRRWGARAGRGCPVSTGFVAKALHRLAQRLATAGFDEAMATALRVEAVLGADESPVNVLHPDTDEATGQPVPGAAHVMVIRTPDQR